MAAPVRISRVTTSCISSGTSISSNAFTACGTAGFQRQYTNFTISLCIQSVIEIGGIRCLHRRRHRS